MSLLQRWLQAHLTPQTTSPLFDEQDLVVSTMLYRSVPVLKRHPDFDELMATTVEHGLQREDWRGIIYVMHWQHGAESLPLYIGKAERKGRTNPLSFNLQNIRSNHQAFGRWGYGLAYHIGDLSHAMFEWEAYTSPARKYRRWAERLFSQFRPPTLRERVHVGVIGWQDGMLGPSGLPGSVPAVEKELIALAASPYKTILLNTDGA